MFAVWNSWCHLNLTFQYLPTQNIPDKQCLLIEITEMSKTITRSVWFRRYYFGQHSFPFLSWMNFWYVQTRHCSNYPFEWIPARSRMLFAKPRNLVHFWVNTVQGMVKMLDYVLRFSCRFKLNALVKENVVKQNNWCVVCTRRKILFHIKLDIR